MKRFFKASVLTLLVAGSPIPAKEPMFSGGLRGFRKAQVWWEGRPVSLDLVFKTITFPGAEGRSQELRPPPNALSTLFWEGEAWAVCWEGGQGLSVARSKDFRTWSHSPHQLLKIGGNYPVGLHPTSRPGLFLGINTACGFGEDGRASVYAWYTQSEKGTFDFLTLVDLDLDLDGRVFVPGMVDGKAVGARPHPARAALAPFFDYPIRLGDRFVLVSLNAGVLWILEDGAGSPKRTLRLVDLEGGQLSGKDPIARCILGLQPTPEGKLLLACRTEEAVKESEKAFRQTWEENGGAADEARARADMERAARVYGRLRWLELDPETGKLERVYPKGAPEHLESRAQLNAFRFELNADGSVKMRPTPKEQDPGSPAPTPPPER